MSASASPPTTTVTHDCGTIDQSLGGVTPTNAHDLAQCLLTSFQTCRPAKLAYDSSGIDSETDHAISVTPSGGKCQVADVSTFILKATSAGGPQPPVRYDCVAVALRGGTVVVAGCGAQGDLVLP